MNPVVHFEMAGGDMERMKKFYQGVFGWKLQQMGSEFGNYVLAQTDETDEQGMLKKTNRINGGFYQGKGGEAPHIVIAVSDLESHMETVKQSGGEIVDKPMDIPGIGMFVMFKDTEGNRVGMLQPSQPM